MKKNLKLTATGYAVCLAGTVAAAALFSGCSNQDTPLQGSAQTTPSATQAAPTAAPTATATPKPAATDAPQATVTPKPAPTDAPQEPAAYPSSNLASMLDAEDLTALAKAGAIAEEPEKVTGQPAVPKEGVQLEKVETFQDHYVVVTLNARLASIDTSDITLRKYSDNWYELSPSTSNMNVQDIAYTLNSEGKTVLIYQTEETIAGARVLPDYSSKKFSNLEAETKTAENYMSWQMDNGGWDKGVKDQAAKAWNGSEPKNKSSGWKAKDGSMLGTIDNDATYTQMRQIAAVYRETKDERYKESVLKGLDFIFNLQYESGGFAQVYPRRGNYSDYVTFNDQAMINVLIMLEDMRDRAYPFDSDIIPDDYIEKIDDSISRAVDYILKAQIISEDSPTAWCAQHDPVTYEPRGGRAYELPSISGSESVAVVKFLIHQEYRTEDPEYAAEIDNAVTNALSWFERSEVKGFRFDKNDPNKEYFIADESSSLWYRFYEIDTNRGLFCDRDGIAKYSITEIGDERRTGYSWSGNWPKKLLSVYKEYGFYENQIEAVITKTGSAAADGSKLQKDTSMAAAGEIAAK